MDPANNDEGEHYLRQMLDEEDSEEENDKLVMKAFAAAGLVVYGAEEAC
jgi:hypothetical protein